MGREARAKASTRIELSELDAAKLGALDGAVARAEVAQMQASDQRVRAETNKQAFFEDLGRRYNFDPTVTYGMRGRFLEPVLPRPAKPRHEA